MTAQISLVPVLLEYTDFEVPSLIYPGGYQHSIGIGSGIEVAIADE